MKVYRLIASFVFKDLFAFTISFTWSTRGSARSALDSKLTLQNISKVRPLLLKASVSIRRPLQASRWLVKECERPFKFVFYIVDNVCC